MFTIAHTFADESESYITVPALKRFAKEKRKEDLKITLDRPELISDIQTYANLSEDNIEIVKNWLDHVLVEGIKDAHIKFIDEENLITANLYDDKYISEILEILLFDKDNRHLSNKYFGELKLFRYDIEQGKNGKSIRIFLGKKISVFDKKKGGSTVLYPIFVEVYVDKGIIVARAKSKAGMYKFMDHFDLENATTTNSDKEIRNAIKFICNALNISLRPSSEVNDIFRTKLYDMLDAYTKTPKEINDLMNAKKDVTNTLVKTIINNICNLEQKYSLDVESDVYNMVEKYFSISYPNKSIFTCDREAYPLKLIATDEEDSRVEQTAALEEPLQSKALFFDNKKMLQKSRLCDGVVFMFNRMNKEYCSPTFKVRIVTKGDHCILKFTEYTMEEDIVHVLFSLINS